MLTDRAIVLRRSDYSETSQVVTFFTRDHGQVRLIAKGLKRGTKTRFATGVDPLELGDLSFLMARGDAGLGILNAWVQRQTFSGLRHDLLRLYGGLYMADAVAALTQEHDSNPGLFDAFANSLGVLETDPAPAAQIADFQLRLLEAIGYAPQLSVCVDCGRAPEALEEAYFSSSSGGLLCRDCEMHHLEKRRVFSGASPNGTRDLRGWRVAIPLLDYHLSQIAGRAVVTSYKMLKALEACGR